MAHGYTTNREDGSRLKIRIDDKSVEITVEAGRDVLGRVTITPKELDTIFSAQILEGQS